VIGSCTDNVFGLRDRAVLLLLDRLGLRASEVAELKFADIDWRNGAITVCGKGRRQESLPLPQEVGNAIMLYLSQGRPTLRVPEVFTSVVAPLRALTRAGCHSHRAQRTASGRYQSADQRCSRPAPLRRRYHAPSGCIPSRCRCGPATPLAHDDGSLR
jgi:integrase